GPVRPLLQAALRHRDHRHLPARPRHGRAGASLRKAQPAGNLFGRRVEPLSRRVSEKPQNRRHFCPKRSGRAASRIFARFAGSSAEGGLAVVRLLFALTLMLATLALPARAETAALPPVDTGYEASPTVSLKVQRAFLDSIRWSS